MKLRMIICSTMDQASEIYKDTNVSLTAIGEDQVLIEATCSFKDAIDIISLDTSEGDRSIDLRR